jgi:hypothetical protein
MQNRKSAPPSARPEPDVAELAAWLRSLGVTREQVERAFRANASRAYPASRASGRPNAR